MYNQFRKSVVFYLIGKAIYNNRCRIIVFSTFFSNKLTNIVLEMIKQWYQTSTGYVVISVLTSFNSSVDVHFRSKTANLTYGLASNVVSVNLFDSEGNTTNFSDERYPVKVTISLWVSICVSVSINLCRINPSLTSGDHCHQNGSILTCLTPVEPKLLPLTSSSITTKRYVVDRSSYTFSESL